MRPSEVQRLPRLVDDIGARAVLDPELHELDAKRHDARNPADVRHDRIKAGELECR